ncbi:uncharacterized protein [Drosophila kikkawai]|uniref:Uncharacterized protein isoform X2 n=1 Tax=Drosophila kikkawai TaxID=30033 RepID=A0A6P4JNL7_DROKI|nr:uncharacterized protein LOC108085212 isoform X2 [Drosophila kikkawai]
MASRKDLQTKKELLDLVQSLREENDALRREKEEMREDFILFIKSLAQGMGVDPACWSGTPAETPTTSPCAAKMCYAHLRSLGLVPPTITLSQQLKNSPVKESKAKETHGNPVSFKLFKRYLSNLPDIVQRMLRCDNQKGKSESEYAREYYKGFYLSQEMRDKYPYKLKPCPAQIRNKLLSFAKKEKEVESETDEDVVID